MVVNDKLFYGIHDSGCTHTIISERLCQRLGLEVTPYTGMFQVASDALSTYKGKVDKFTCKLHKEITLAAPYIRVSSSAKPYLIIGNDLLTRVISGALYCGKVFRDRWVVEFELPDHGIVVTCPTVRPLSERDC